MTKEERLLNAIYNYDDDKETPDCLPETFYEKAAYAELCLQKSLEFISPALRRISRLCRLLKIGLIEEENGKTPLPDIITFHEARAALEYLFRVSSEVNETRELLVEIYDDTKGAADNVQKNDKTE